MSECIPLVSIVTINFNNLAGLKQTFAGVISQTDRDFEYVVIDGGSVDGTVEFLREHSQYLSYWSSEPDRGIYDAMNKGVKVAKGEWIIFMNSGDLFYADDTLAQIAPYLTGKNSANLDRSPDVVYGEWESIFDDEYGYRTKRSQPSDIAEIWHQIPACHQSVLVRRELISQYPFDLSIKWCADHDLLARLYQLGCKFQQIPIVVSKFDATGGHVRDLLMYTRERWSICRRYFETTPERESYFMKEYQSFWWQERLNKPLRKIVPKQWTIALRKIRGIY